MMDRTLERAAYRTAEPPRASGGRELSQMDGSAPVRERRRRNRTLRNLVDGLLEHVRDLSDEIDELSPQELEAEHERFNLIADLMWAAITDEKNRPR